MRFRLVRVQLTPYVLNISDEGHSFHAFRFNYQYTICNPECYQGHSIPDVTDNTPTDVISNNSYLSEIYNASRIQIHLLSTYWHQVRIYLPITVKMGPVNEATAGDRSVTLRQYRHNIIHFTLITSASTYLCTHEMYQQSVNRSGISFILRKTIKNTSQNRRKYPNDVPTDNSI